MAPTIHFILISLVALTAIFLAARNRPPKRGLESWLGGIGAALLLSLVALSLSMHMCTRGTAFQQWFVPALSVIVVWGFVESRRTRLIYFTIATILAIGLSLHYAGFVHQKGWIGNPGSKVPDAAGKTEPQWHTFLTGIYRYDE